MTNLGDLAEVAWPFMATSLVIAVFLRPLRVLLDTLADMIDAILNRIVTSIRTTATRIPDLGRSIGSRIAEFLQAVSVIPTGPIAGVTTALDWLGQQRHRVISEMFAEETRTWEIAGAVLYAAALALFIYADISIGANNLELMLGADEDTVPLPTWVRQLVIPLIIASAGSAFALGVVLADLFGATHFAHWPAKRRTALAWLALMTLTSVLVISVLIGLSRLPTVEGVQLSESQLGRIRMLGGLAQVAVIVPLLITTALLWWGVLGLVVAYVCALALVSLPLLLARFLLALLKEQGASIGRGLANLVVAAFIVLAAPVRLLAWLFDLIREFAILLIPVLTKVLDLVAYPFTTIGSFVSRPFARQTRGSFEQTESTLPPTSVADTSASSPPASEDPGPIQATLTDEEVAKAIEDSLPKNGRTALQDLLASAARELGTDLTPEIETTIRRELRALQGRTLETDWKEVWRMRAARTRSATSPAER